jgi:meiotically up-regulated gene 157 (Mug157) protein
MICVELKHLETLLASLSETAAISNLASLVSSVKEPLCDALQQLVSSASADNSKLPFEIDGFGSQYFMDDANLPSLLSMPLTGYLSTSNAVYLSTRKFALSTDNPYFFSGTEARGIGGPHVGYNYAWPMALVVQAMTSSSDEEVHSLKLRHRPPYE